jgi:hypothetical protein
MRGWGSAAVSYELRWLIADLGAGADLRYAASRCVLVEDITMAEAKSRYALPDRCSLHLGRLAAQVLSIHHFNDGRLYFQIALLII